MYIVSLQGIDKLYFLITSCPLTYLSRNPNDRDYPKEFLVVYTRQFSFEKTSPLLSHSSLQVNNTIVWGLISTFSYIFHACWSNWQEKLEIRTLLQVTEAADICQQAVKSCSWSEFYLLILI